MVGHRFKKLQRAVFCSFALRFPKQCAALLPASVPLIVHRYESTRAKSRDEVMVFLPGIGDFPEDYKSQGFIEAVRQSRPAIDMIVVDLHFGYYLRRAMLERLRKDVILPAKAQGYDKIWLVGISLGGLGAMLYAFEHSEDIKGLMLLAPYLGEEAIVGEVANAGGVAMWEPGEIAEDDYQRKLWRRVKRHALEKPELPVIYLGYGDLDKFGPANRLLAEALPKEHLFITSGGHDWRTWSRLWETFLAIHESAEKNSGQQRVR
jgi:pimeloyl-ACP methyl ester carboxylesterase